MTEYLCTATVDGLEFEFETMGAVTLIQAVDQFENYLAIEKHRILALASKCNFTRLKAE